MAMLGACGPDSPQALTGPEIEVSPIAQDTVVRGVDSASLGLPQTMAAVTELRGVQAVLMHCWSAASRNEFISTVRASKVSRIAIGLAPFIGRCTMPRGMTELSNLKAVVTSLRSSGIGVDVFVHLGGFQDANPSPSLATHFWTLWSSIIVPNKNDAQVTVHVSGSLEDQYASATETKQSFDRMLTALTSRQSGDQDVAVAVAARKATLQALTNASRFTFHRSPLRCGDSGTQSVSVLSGALAVKVTHERHGSTPSGCTPSRFAVWSNDGPFVANEYAGYRERCVSAAGADGCGLSPAPAAIPMATFRNTSFAGGYRLLWRPAYNLFKATNASSGGVTTRTFTKTGTPRADDGTAGFDQYERSALLAFLK